MPNPSAHLGRGHGRRLTFSLVQFSRSRSEAPITRQLCKIRAQAFVNQEFQHSSYSSRGIAKSHLRDRNSGRAGDGKPTWPATLRSGLGVNRGELDLRSADSPLNGQSFGGGSLVLAIALDRHSGPAYRRQFERTPRGRALHSSGNPGRYT